MNLVPALVIGVVLFVAAFAAGVAKDWYLRRRDRRLAEERMHDEARLVPGFDDRPECPRGHGHMERFMTHGWWCKTCMCSYLHQCPRCATWMPEDWTGCVVCGLPRPSRWDWL